MTQKALIYCRVSSAAQVRRGHGLDGQEARCREYAQAQGYAVAEVFPDDVSGGGDFMNRPGMKRLIAYLDAYPDENFVVIFDDLKRFARDTEFHIRLRREMDVRGARRECLNFNFEDSPEGEFIETIMAAQGQLEREQNKRQVIQKMKARCQRGYWLFSPVIGYKYEDVPGHGKMLAPDEPVASIIRETLESFACGHLQTATEVARFLTTKPEIPKNKYGEYSAKQACDLLRRPHYAGYITVAKWGMHMIPAQHEPLISVATWEAIQNRLAGNATVHSRVDTREDFPMRGFVECTCCGNALTGAWSRGRSKRYAYYVCQTRSCDLKGKSIRKEKIEGEFETFLRELQPSHALFQLAYATFKDEWDRKLKQVGSGVQAAKAELDKLKRKAAALVDKIVDADDPEIAIAYESRLKQISAQKALMAEKVENGPQAQGTFEDMYRTAMQFLASPCKIWASDRLEHKRLVLKLTFPKRVQYCREEGYRTAEIALPFRVLGDFHPRNGGMVEPSGIEPLTSSLRTTRSPN